MTQGDNKSVKTMPSPTGNFTLKGVSPTTVESNVQKKMDEGEFLTMDELNVLDQ
jgi:hypothetical protein